LLPGEDFSATSWKTAWFQPGLAWSVERRTLLDGDWRESQDSLQTGRSKASSLPFDASLLAMAVRVDIGTEAVPVRRAPGGVIQGLDTVFRQLLKQGLEHFMPAAQVELLSPVVYTDDLVVACYDSPRGVIEFDWLGYRYRVNREGGFTDDLVRMVKSVGRVLSIRYRLAFHPVLAAESAHLFRGLPEDRYVSAFLDSSTYRDPDEAASRPDRIASAIEVLRLSAMTTYENRRISTGVILFGSQPDACHELPLLPEGALRYSSDLTSTRSFYRLSDGLNTVALVNREGLLVELVDVEEWALPFRDFELPAPVAARYEFHSRATLCGGHICMILTAYGEIKVFAGGAQVFTFRDGRWHFANTAECYRLWSEAIRNKSAARRLFAVALDLAEDRRGALFVVLDDATLVHRLVSTEDLLRTDPSQEGDESLVKRRFHYLLRDQDALRLPPSVLESVARIDGAIVLDQDANLLSFGAILQNSIAGASIPGEGSRTAAAVAASHFGAVLKVSEDGMVSYFRGGQCLWEL
jgi:DNA integrity scanning protein DisA with diadenylate cyclase activity